MAEISRESEIRIKVGLDKENIPARIAWKSEDSDNKGKAQTCKALLLSLFDAESKETLKIDLWTKDMQVIEMDRFMFQTLRALADTYYRATQNKELANERQRFVQFFGEKTEIIPKGDS
ncbi:MAG: gliding motility protein GldC [Saprospiraceae bacterium]|nr:gliding motility protein GldC [Saprospiraceae bacterium]